MTSVYARAAALKHLLQKHADAHAHLVAVSLAGWILTFWPRCRQVG